MILCAADSHAFWVLLPLKAGIQPSVTPQCHLTPKPLAVRSIKSKPIIGSFCRLKPKIISEAAWVFPCSFYHLHYNSANCEMNMEMENISTLILPLY